MDKITPSSGHVLAFLSWIDVIERLDTLMLDIRHIQTNLIHHLREPMLYRLLKYEEEHLWGNSDAFKIHLSKHDVDYKILSSVFVVDYPLLFSQEISQKNFYEIPEPIKEVIKNIRTRLIDLWTSGVWSLEKKRFYKILQTFQVIKRNILHDKLEICKCGFNSFAINNADKNSSSLSESYCRFVLLRVAVIQRIWGYVERIGDLQDQFFSIEDMSIDGDTKPLLGTRREQGTYNSVLSDRCRDLSEEINNMLDDIGAQKSPKWINIEECKVMHRRVYDFTSHAERFQDECFSNGYKRLISFINTSYWMPDRPDLQSIIAHEVAHTAIFERYKDLSRESVYRANDHFGRLIKQLWHCYETYGLSLYESSDPSFRARRVLKEISCDLAAATIEGPSYLYALFLEISGQGLENIFYMPDDSYSLDIAINLEKFIFEKEDFGYILDRLWYYRLKLVCIWLRSISFRTELSPLEKLLFDGVEEVADKILDYLQANNPDSMDINYKWRQCCTRMSELVRHSRASAIAKNWLKARSEDYQKKGRTGPKLRRRCNRRLNGKVRDYLFNMLLTLKKQKGQIFDFPKIFDNKQLCRAFDENYFGKCYEAPVGNNDVKIGSRPLFQHIYDIPWQCSIIRGQEFIREHLEWGHRHEYKDWMGNIHKNAALGRELFHVALEFYFWCGRSGFQRLGTVIAFLERVKEERNGLPENIDSWLGTESKLRVEKIEYLWTQIESVLKRYKEKNNRGRIFVDRIEIKKLIAPLIKEHPARSLFYLHPVISGRTVDNESKTMLEKIYGYKLQQLIDIFEKEFCQKVKVIPEVSATINAKLCRLQVMYNYLQPIYSYLSIRKRDDINHELSIKFLVDSLDQKDNMSKEKELYPIRLFQITRTVFGGIAYSSKKDQEQYKNNSRLSLVEVLSNPPFEIEDVSDNDEMMITPPKETSTGWAQPVLGKEDLISFIPVRPLYRNKLPKYGKDKKYSEIWPPFYERKEMAILFPWKNVTWHKIKTPILAMLSVRLNQRNARLSFIARIINARILSCYGYESATIPEVIEDIGPYFLEQDSVFLVDGWSDILLVFFINDTISQETAKRIDHIYEIENVVSNDFQVAEAHITFTPEAIRILEESSMGYYVKIKAAFPENRGNYICGKRIFEKGKREKKFTVLKGASGIEILMEDTVLKKEEFHLAGYPKLINLLGVDDNNIDFLQTEILRKI